MVNRIIEKQIIYAMKKLDFETAFRLSNFKEAKNGIKR